MTHTDDPNQTPADDSLTTEAEFHGALRALLLSAHEAGIDVEGGWDVLYDDEHRCWGVEIFEVVTG